MARTRCITDDEVKQRLHQKLESVVATYFTFEMRIDDNMRTIPDHYHAHARPKGGFYGHGMRRPSVES